MPRFFPVGNLHLKKKSYSKTDYNLKDGHTNFLIEDDEPHVKKV